MRKIIYCALVLVIIFAACASAATVATLSRANSDSTNIPEVADSSYIENYKKMIAALVFDKDFDNSVINMKFYDSLMQMQMALSNREIDAIATPECVGEYMILSNSNYTLRGLILGRFSTALAFGFLEENKGLRDRFSRAVEEMEREGAIGLLEKQFIGGLAAVSPPAVDFEKFDGAQTINVALTGDQPPLDYVAPDGKPAGFSTAMLAEIGKRLRININPIIVETGARTMALKSGRADVVFWFQIFTGYDKQPDIADGIITSTPYYGWNKSWLIGRK